MESIFGNDFWSECRGYYVDSTARYMYRVGQKTGPLCYIASNFGNTAQI